MKKETLNDASRERLAHQIVAGEIGNAEAVELKLLTDVSGRHWSIRQFFSNSYRYGCKLTVCDRGESGKGDAVHQAKLAFVMSQETVGIFGCRDGRSLLKLIQRIDDSARRWKHNDDWKFIPFEQIADKFDDSHIMVPETEWTPKEIAILHAIGSESWRVCRALDDSRGRNNRKLVLGRSGTASGWTDGYTFIAFDRKWLERHIAMGMGDCVSVSSLLLHEYCHDASDKGSHVHSPEFYQKFHDAAMQDTMACVADTLFKRVSNDLERAGFHLSKKAIKIKDKIIRTAEEGEKLSAAERRIAALQVPKVEPKKAEAKGKPSGSSPYRGKYGILFEEASNWIGLDDLLGRVSRRTGQSKEQVRMSFNVLANASHSSNKGRSEKGEKDGMVRLVAKQAL